MVTVRAPERTPDRPCVDCLDQPQAARRAGPAVRRRVAFWVAGLILGITMLGTTLPTPLYVIYQAQWHFSAAIVTVTFAVYAVAVLATLLLAGRSSDQAGRKPVLAVALGGQRAEHGRVHPGPRRRSADRQRILSGLSAGLMTGTATAALTELVPASASRRGSLVATAANMGGLGLGPLIAGLFAQYAPEPHHLGVRGVPGRAGGRWPVPVPGPRNGEPAPPAGVASRPGHPGARPGRVHRRRRSRVRRLLPARPVRRAGAHLPRERPAREQPRRPGRRRVPAAGGRDPHPAGC